MSDRDLLLSKVKGSINNLTAKGPLVKSDHNMVEFLQGV